MHKAPSPLQFESGGDCSVIFSHIWLVEQEKQRECRCVVTRVGREIARLTKQNELGSSLSA
jgi:hypothetical protein